MKCIYCGKEIDDKSKFCKYCGSSVPPKNERPNSDTSKGSKQVCESCGAELKPGMKFCTKCGTPVKTNNDKSYATGNLNANNKTPKKKEKSKESSGGKTAIIVISIVVAALVVMAGAFFGGKFIMEKYQEKNQVQKEIVSDDFDEKEKLEKEEKVKEEEKEIESEDNIKVAEEKEEEPVNALEDENAYIIPESDQVYLTEDDIKDLTAQELNYAKNEIYARRGRLFVSNELQKYFNSKTWYHGQYSGDKFDRTITLTDIEKKNAELIKDREFILAPGGYPLDK